MIQLSHLKDINFDKIVRQIIKYVKIKPEKRTEVILWTIIAAATLLRFLYPFYVNPINNIWSDPKRHYLHGLGMGQDTLSFLDPLGYQIWLTVIFKLIGTEPLEIAWYAGVLSAITPWIWYQWLEECLPSRKAAVIGYAILACLPSWIAIYSFFMPETLLLPLLGLALWISWWAKRKDTYLAYLCAAFTWGCVVATKFTVVPVLFVLGIWLFRHLLKHKTKRQVLLITASCSSIIFVMYLASPIYTYVGLGNFWLYPPGSSRAHQTYCENGARKLTCVFIGKDGNTHVGQFESPSLMEKYNRFLGWKSKRTGHTYAAIDMREKPQLIIPGKNMTITEWFDLTIENAVFYLTGASWPECRVNDPISQLTTAMRWSWLPLTVLTLALVASTRKVAVVEWLFVVTILANLVQHVGVMEARYRKPWEGLVIAALLSTGLSLIALLNKDRQADGASYVRRLK